MDSLMNETLVHAIKKAKIKSWLIYEDGNLSFEFYKNSKIKTNPQKINSCTKSVISILIGIAIEKGFIKDTSMTLNDFFPEIVNKQDDKRKQNITIEHLLTMSAGFDWPEFGEWNCFSPMVFSRDLVKFVIDRELVDEPGFRMNYNSGCSHLLAAILQKSTGMKAVDFANAFLFKPLDITSFNWVEDNKGINQGADGLRLTTDDMAKIGLLYLNDGVFNSKRIVSSKWINISTQPYYLTYKHIGHYGFHWWIRYTELGTPIHFALGYGGQYICIIPRLNMVIAITSEMYNDSLNPLLLLEHIILKHYNV